MLMKLIILSVIALVNSVNSFNQIDVDLVSKLQQIFVVMQAKSLLPAPTKRLLLTKPLHQLDPTKNPRSVCFVCLLRLNFNWNTIVTLSL